MRNYNFNLKKHTHGISEMEGPLEIIWIQALILQVKKLRTRVKGLPHSWTGRPWTCLSCKKAGPIWVDRAGACHTVCQGAAVWSLCTCFCARALLGICAHSSEPTLGLFLLRGTTRAPPRLLGASQGLWGWTRDLGSCPSQLWGAQVSARGIWWVGQSSKRPRDLHRSLWPWTVS